MHELERAVLSHNDAIVAAIESVLKDGPRTPDLGGTANTTQVDEAIAALVSQGG